MERNFIINIFCLLSQKGKKLNMVKGLIFRKFKPCFLLFKSLCSLLPLARSCALAQPVSCSGALLLSSLSLTRIHIPHTPPTGTCMHFSCLHSGIFCFFWSACSLFTCIHEAQCRPAVSGGCFCIPSYLRLSLLCAFSGDFPELLCWPR